MAVTGKEVRGKPVSGRVWKPVEKQRYSAIKTKTVKALSTSWKKKTEIRRKLHVVKEMEKDMKERKQQAAEEQKKAREERMKRRMENEMKATSYQVISKTEKLKTMSKKQLRAMKKTRMNKLGVVELVGAYQ